MGAALLGAQLFISGAHADLVEVNWCCAYGNDRIIGSQKSK